MIDDFIYSTYRVYNQTISYSILCTYRVYTQTISYSILCTYRVYTQTISHSILCTYRVCTQTISLQTLGITMPDLFVESVIYVDVERTMHSRKWFLLSLISRPTLSAKLPLFYLEVMSETRNMHLARPHTSTSIGLTPAPQ